MFDEDVMKLCEHESYHAAAALSVGRRLFSITRAGHGPHAHGATHSESRDGETVEDGLVVLLSAVYGQPRGADGDIRNAMWLAQQTDDPDGAMRGAGDRVLKLMRDSSFRRVQRAIETELWSHTSLSGEEVDQLLQEAKV